MFRKRKISDRHKHKIKEFGGREMQLFFLHTRPFNAYIVKLCFVYSEKWKKKLSLKTNRDAKKSKNNCRMSIDFYCTFAEQLLN